jgi:hypothetical protein
VLHTWKVLSTWLVFAAIFTGFFLLLSVWGEEMTDHACEDVATTALAMCVQTCCICCLIW